MPRSAFSAIFSSSSRPFLQLNLTTSFQKMGLLKTLTKHLSNDVLQDGISDIHRVHFKRHIRLWYRFRRWRTDISTASNHVKPIGTSTLPVRHQVSLSIRFINAWTKEPKVAPLWWHVRFNQQKNYGFHIISPAKIMLRFTLENFFTWCLILAEWVQVARLTIVYESMVDILDYCYCHGAKLKQE